MKKNVVTVSGGNGSALTLCALKEFRDTLTIAAVVAMTDSGGANGELSKRLGVLPSADVLRAILALSPHDYQLLHKIFRDNRFSNGDFKGHYLGNLFLMLVAKQENNYMHAVQYCEEAVEAVGHVYPSTLDMTDLYVELQDGSRIIGEADIDRPIYDRSKKITRVWIAPEATLYAGAKKAIIAADYIVLGPGSLYTSIIPNLLVKGMREAIVESKAKLVFVTGSCYEADGETGPEKLSDFVSQLQSYLPRTIDTLIYSTHVFSQDEMGMLLEKKWKPAEIDSENVRIPHMHGVDFEKRGGGVDVQKLKNVFEQLLINNTRI